MERRLYGVRIMPSVGHRLFLRAALRMRMVVDAAMRSAALNRFLMAAPTFPEIGTLYHLVHILRMRKFDHLILDLPATGHALGLASLPKTVLKVLPSGLIGDAIREGLAAMTDPARGGAVVVTLPEHMPVTEALELSQGLTKLSIPLQAIVLNRMPDNPFSDEERRALAVHMQGRAHQPKEDLSSNTPELESLPLGKHKFLLGTREFRRLERALLAQKMFRAMVPLEQQREVSLLNERDPQQIMAHVEAALR